MNDPIPKISIQDLSTLLGAALGGPVRASDLHGAVIKPPAQGAPVSPNSGDLLEQLLKNVRRQ